MNLIFGSSWKTTIKWIQAFRSVDQISAAQATADQSTVKQRLLEFVMMLLEQRQSYADTDLAEHLSVAAQFLHA